MVNQQESSDSESTEDGNDLFFVVEDEVDQEDVGAIVNTVKNLQLKKLLTINDLVIRQPAKYKAVRTQLGAIGMF